MKEVKIKTFEDLIEKLGHSDNKFYFIYRGQSNADWELTPKIGRQPFNDFFSSNKSERKYFESWKRYAIQFLNSTPVDDWDWLTLAQHHGLATRLLDWTKNPLIATFFSVYQSNDFDVAVFAYEATISKREPDSDPFSIKKVHTFYPKGISNRVVNQRGLFTIFNNPDEPLEKSEESKLLTKFVIPKSKIHEIQQKLDFFGINEFTVFPDLDGLSRYINNYVIDLKTSQNRGTIIKPELPFG